MTRPADEPRAPALAVAPPFNLGAVMLPIVATLVAIATVYFFIGHDAGFELLTIGLVTATVAGKFGVLLANPDGFLATPYHLAAIIVWLDCSVAFVAVYNAGALFRIPGFGKKLAELRVFCGLTLTRNPWMRKAAFFGVVAFVLFPLSGTGAIGGSLFGQLLGLSRRKTMVGIFIGAMIGAFGLAALAGVIMRTLGEDVANSPIFRWGGLALILVAVLALSAQYKKMAKRMEAEGIDLAAVGGAEPSAPEAAEGQPSAEPEGRLRA